MLDYKNIIIKRYALSLSGSEIARQLGAIKSGVNDFLRAFEKCEFLSYPLPPGITNYGIAEIVYGSIPRQTHVFCFKLSPCASTGFFMNLCI